MNHFKKQVTEKTNRKKQNTKRKTHVTDLNIQKYIIEHRRYTTRTSHVYNTNIPSTHLEYS